MHLLRVSYLQKVYDTSWALHSTIFNAPYVIEAFEAFESIYYNDIICYLHIRSADMQIHVEAVWSVCLVTPEYFKMTTMSTLRNEM